MGFKLIRQRDAMGCGIACLRMVCMHHGLPLTQERAEQLCSATTEGVSLLAVKQAAEALGLEALGAKLGIDALAHVNMPAVLHWNQNHFVVIYKTDDKGRRFWIADPGKGKYTVSRSELIRHWMPGNDDGQDKGLAMLFEPGDGFRPDSPHNGGERRSFRFLWEYVMRYKSYFGQILLGLLLGCVLQLAMPFLTQWIVDLGIYHRDIKLIWLILLGELMIVAGRASTDFVRRWMLLHISMRINISLVSDFFVKLLRLPMSFFDTKLMGDLLQRIADHSRVQSFLTTQVLGVMFTMLSFMVFGIVLLVYDRLVFTVFIGGSIVYGLWIARFLARRKVLDYELFEQQAISQNRTYQFITAMQEIKLQDCERRRRWEWEDTQADMFEVQMKSMKLQQAQEAGSIFINEIKNILITVLAANAVINDQITLGAMLAIQYIVGQLNSPVEQLMQFVYAMQDVKISLERINEIHAGRDEEDGRGGAECFSGSKSIALRDVTFKYDKHALVNTLSGVSLDIAADKVTAIVGASGSGKTTLVRLMLGYYPAGSGSISVAGRDIANYSLRWWRRQCGVVMQDGVIFSESIARNIAVSDAEIDTQRMEQAARIACIHDFVQGLPLKYATKIGRDGMGLSQGQKQRVLIARAVYKNPSFIFLDEATNALDAKNERDIVQNLAEFYRGRTVVVVAHRLSTVRDADCIVVLDAGTVVETGTHDELIARHGAYYTLVRNQLELGS